jgi:two-component system response regulator LytT
MHVLLIEDEPVAARKLKRLLEAHSKISSVLAVIDSVETGIEWLHSNPAPDLIVSDIQLADGLSFSIFSQLENCPPIIFVTAYDQYALQAFRTQSIDYLLKPVTEEDLNMALEKFESIRGSNAHKDSVAQLEQFFDTESDKDKSAERRRFLVRIGTKLIALEVEKAAYFFVENRIVFYLDQNGKKYPLDLSLDELEGILDKSRYFRINRQFIVSIESIKEMQVVSKSRVKLALLPAFPEHTIVSKERSPVFRHWIQGIDEKPK